MMEIKIVQKQLPVYPLKNMWCPAMHYKSIIEKNIIIINLFIKITN